MLLAHYDPVMPVLSTPCHICFSCLCNLIKFNVFKILIFGDATYIKSSDFSVHPFSTLSAIT